jgi:tRNA(Ile)-lysidine synthase
MRLRRLEPVLRRALRGPCALPAGSRVLVAVSGGADSTALLLGLESVAREFGLSVVAAHLDHGLRGDASAADRDHVRRLCRRLRIRLLSARVDAAARMGRERLRGESGLRVLRRRFLLAAARRAEAVAIATGHTADDQLETVLMRLARGTGPTGLGGMRPRRGRWLKPLLEVDRATIEAELGRHRVTWREDATNAQPEFARSRLRHDVVPALVRALAPGADPVRARATLARNAARAAAEATWGAHRLERTAEALLRDAARIQPTGIALDSTRLAPYPFAVRRMVLRRLWRRLDPAAPGLTRPVLDGLDRLIGRPNGMAVMDLPAGWRAELDRNRMLSFHRTEHAPSGARSGFGFRAVPHAAPSEGAHPLGPSRPSPPSG